MKAIQIEKHGGPEVMETVDLPVPEPGEGEVRVKVEAVGLNFSDIMIREGRYVDEMPLPFVLGREFCGSIDAVGPGAGELAPGQRVIGGNPMGGALAEFLVAKAARLSPIPEGFTPVEGAALRTQGLTAMMIMDNAVKVQPGETVLVHAAAGGVGGLAVQIALARGARVIGTTSSEAKCRMVAKLGAEAVNYTEGDWVKEVLALTDGKGADIILESIGGEILLRSYNEALAIFGRLVIYGAASGDIVQFDNREILASNRTLMGFYLSRHFPDHLDRIGEAIGKLLAMIRAGTLKLTIDQTFPLERAADAFNHIQTRKNTGKVVVIP
ncbi:MAG: zinc-binding dehydrogenase [bacterium]